MLKIFLNLLILLKIFIILQAKQKTCNFSDCNNEGICTLNEQNEKLCSCIGKKYFQGPNCSEAIDLCEIEKPCRNDAKCKPIVGQFICENCSDGFGGLWCDLKVSNVFENMLLYFNHYGFYGEKHKFLIMVETLGEQEFSLEFMADNYAIASFETKQGKNNKWIYTNDLPRVTKKLGIRYYNDTPYTKGYYHVASETFWDLGQFALTLRCYDTETAALFFYQNQFDILITQRQMLCVPQLKFIHGVNPLEPLMVDIASYNNFEIILKKRCFNNSLIKYQWSVFNSLGVEKLHDFGFSKELILKIQPYKLWFNYHGEVMSSYSLVVKMLEVSGWKRRETQTRCFIFVLPKPVSALINGGNYREIGVNQDFILNASNSRDFALAPNVKQDLSYSWNCVSHEDSNSIYCRNNMSSAQILNIKSGYLQLHKTYNFTLTINSKVNKFITDQTYQLVKIMPHRQLNIDLKCLRNCVRNQFIAGDIMHLKAVTPNKVLSKSAYFQWSLEEEIIGFSQHLVYKIKEDCKILIIQLLIQDQDLTGKVQQTFKVNLAPRNGSCSIEPSKGEAFITNFHIKCLNYIDNDTPLSYEYLQENGFPLQRTNEGEIHTKLAPCNTVIIKVCDQFQACLENQIKVEVKALEEVKNVEDFVKSKEVGFKQLLLQGDILTAMILLKTLTTSIKTIADLKIIEKEMEMYEIKTLLEIEQFMEINNELVQNNLPLTQLKANVFNKYFMKLRKGFKRILKDEEIQTFKSPGYEKSCEELMQIMQNFAQNWETIAPVQTLQPLQTVTSLEPLKELYPVLADFNINIADQLKNWLESSRNLMDCFNFLLQGAKELYIPGEEIFSLEQNNFYLKILAFDNSSQQVLELNDNKLKVLLDEACIQELQLNFQSPDIQLQMVSLNSNPFWWFPQENPLSTEVFFFNILSRKSKKTLKYLKNPFEFQLQLKAQENNYNTTTGTIKSALHMSVYKIQLPANAVLIITFLKTTKSLKFLIQIEKAPSSFKVHQAGHTIDPLKHQQSFIFPNPLNRKTQTFLALIMETPFSENTTFSFYTKIKECLYWDFSLSDPQWSSQGCKPKMAIQNDDILNCYCHHLSAFAGSIYQAAMQEDLKDYLLLKELSINWFLAGFYLIVTVVGLIIIFINFYQYQKRNEFLPINYSSSLNTDIEIQIFTGSHWNSGSTANITLRLISPKGPFSLTIHQNPQKPFLKRNSLCKLLLSSQDIQLPVKLNLANDLNGRYPCWYCHKIQIRNLKNQGQQQQFLINQWINQQPIEIINTKSQSFTNRFQENLTKIYINWFKFQALWGCWLYEDLNRLERCCLWWSQFMVSIVLIATYFGSTTLENYEEERIRYYYLNFNILELFLLSIISYLLNFLVNLLFRFSLWIFN